jgi:predicted nucleic acid-binding protein
VSPQHQRHFLLDSGGVTALATSKDLLTDYLTMLERRFDGSILIPIAVVTEFRTGDPRKDVPVDRLINAMRRRQQRVYVPLTLEIAERAGVLRTQARASGHPDISVTDAHIVATADDLANHSAVTILTGDPEHMKVLVELTRRPNIAVDVP